MLLILVVKKWVMILVVCFREGRGGGDVLLILIIKKWVHDFSCVLEGGGGRVWLVAVKAALP